MLNWLSKTSDTSEPPCLLQNFTERQNGSRVRQDRSGLSSIKNSWTVPDHTKSKSLESTNKARPSLWKSVIIASLTVISAIAHTHITRLNQESTTNIPTSKLKSVSPRSRSKTWPTTSPKTKKAQRTRDASSPGLIRSPAMLTNPWSTSRASRPTRRQWSKPCKKAQKSLCPSAHKPLLRPKLKSKDKSPISKKLKASNKKLNDRWMIN